MKFATVEVWGSVFGEDLKVKEVAGTLEELIPQIASLSPVKSTMDIKQTLNLSVWADSVQWMGGHQLGLRVVSVRESSIALLRAN